MKSKLLLAGLFISIHFGSNAQCTIDQSQLLTNSSISVFNISNDYIGQSFTPGTTGLLCEIDLLMLTAMTGTGTLKIFSGTDPFGFLLTTQSVNVNVPAGPVWQNWTISSPPSVTSGLAYYFRFIPTVGGGIPNPFSVSDGTANPYLGGQCIASAGASGLEDLVFRTLVNTSTGINDITTSTTFVIFPNPFSSQTTIQTSANIKDAILTVYNSYGQIVKEIKNINGQTITLHQDNLPSGLYFIRLTEDNKTFTTDKLIITD